MLRALCADHLGATLVYYFDVPFDETVRRHATRPLFDEITSEQMRGWFTPDDRLGVDGESVIPASSSLTETVASIYRVALADARRRPASSTQPI